MRNHPRLWHTAGAVLSPKSKCLPLVASVCVLILGLALPFPRLAAFPPSPHYKIYGMIRDQVGATLRVQGAELVLLRGNAEIGRAPVNPDTNVDWNYELNIRIDQARQNTRAYSSKAVPAQGIYSLYVEMNGEKFYPIEVAGTLRAGNGGERVRLDLNLGADTDLDGLPDVWEAWQLYQSGRQAGADGKWNLSLIDRNGDFDGDGVSNYQEYLAGTFAGDATERFELKIRGKTATEASFEFFGITGKVYSIEESTDLRAWTPVRSALTSGGATDVFHRATVIAILPIYVPTTGSARFYRLAVR